MMMVSDLSPQELQAAGFLIEAIRNRTGSDRWDRPGIVGQLRTALAGEPLDQALTIALAAADDPDAATPAAFSWAKYRHRPQIGRAGGRGPVCRHCQRTRYACERAQINTGQDHHDFEPEQRQ